MDVDIMMLLCISDYVSECLPVSLLLLYVSDRNGQVYIFYVFNLIFLN